MEDKEIQYGNNKDEEIFTNSLTKKELKDLSKMLRRMALLLKKCDLGESVMITFKYKEDGIIQGYISSYTDTGDYTNPEFMRS